MKTKIFDCVEMKRRGAEWVQKQIHGISAQQELDFWNKQTEALRHQQIMGYPQSDKTLVNSQDELEQLAEKAAREYREGRTTEMGIDEL